MDFYLDSSEGEYSGDEDLNSSAVGAGVSAAGVSASIQKNKNRNYFSPPTNSPLKESNTEEDFVKRYDIPLDSWNDGNFQDAPSFALPTSVIDENDDGDENNGNIYDNERRSISDGTLFLTGKAVNSEEAVSLKDFITESNAAAAAMTKPSTSITTDAQPSSPYLTAISSSISPTTSSPLRRRRFDSLKDDLLESKHKFEQSMRKPFPSSVQDEDELYEISELGSIIGGNLLDEIDFAPRIDLLSPMEGMMKDRGNGGGGSAGGIDSFYNANHPIPQAQSNTKRNSKQLVWDTQEGLEMIRKNKPTSFLKKLMLAMILFVVILSIDLVIQYCLSDQMVRMYVDDVKKALESSLSPWVEVPWYYLVNLRDVWLNNLIV